MRNVVRPKIFGEKSQTTLAPKVDLPQAITGGIEALEKESVARAASVDVRDTPLVNNNLSRFLKSR